jgi:hypothetical protein
VPWFTILFLLSGQASHRAIRELPDWNFVTPVLDLVSPLQAWLREGRNMADTHTPLEALRGSMRQEIIAAHGRAWAWIARPGTWMDGRERVAVAAEARLARSCPLCEARKNALSPFSLQGEHNATGILPGNQIDAIHRLATDPGRLTRDWLYELFDDGLADGVYVESAAIVAMVACMDTFSFAVGVEEAALPEPLPGEPARYRPPGAKINDTWIATINPGDQVPDDGPVYGARASGVHRALSLVPPAKIAVFDLLMAHYIPPELIVNFEATDISRAITRPQAEVLASRVSVLNQCLF